MANYKTITLTGGEEKVMLSGMNAWVRNDGASVIYAAKKEGITAGVDGVVSIPAGCSAPVFDFNGTLFLLGSGPVQIIGSDFSINPFECVSSGGAADIVADAADIVTLDGLQGGVPFSDITLSGDDIVGQEITLTVCGKNLIPYPYRYSSMSINGITFTVNEDKSISVSGTATSNTNFYLIFDHMIEFCSGTYSMSGCPIGGSLNTFRMEAFYYDDSNVCIFSHKDIGNGVTFELTDRMMFGIRIAVYKDVVCDNLLFCPQLEYGSKATEYEPYSGSTTTVTPDSDLYTVPNDIRQQDVINNISVSAGNVSVTGVKRDAAIKKIWDKLDELTAAIIFSNGEN